MVDRIEVATASSEPAASSSEVASGYRRAGYILDDEEEPALIADLQLHDCLIVGVSTGFTALTGFPREEALGQNCRMMLQGVPEVAISKSARKNLRDFCRMCKIRTLDNISEVTSLQPNSRRDGTQFVNFFLVGLVQVGTDKYLLGVQRLVGEGLFVSLHGRMIEEVTEAARDTFKRIRQRLLSLDSSAGRFSRVDHQLGFTFFSERLQDHCLLLNGNRTAMRREPQELATNCLVFGNAPVKMTPSGLYFAVRIEDAVTTFEGLPIMGFTRRRPVDHPSLYPTVCRCLGASVLVGACGEAFARDQTEHFRIGFRQPPQTEVASWSTQADVPPHKRRAPVNVNPGDVFGCLYTMEGRLQLWRNGSQVLDFDVGRPIQQGADYYAVVDVCLAAYSVSLLPHSSPSQYSESSAHEVSEDPRRGLPYGGYGPAGSCTAEVARAAAAAPARKGPRKRRQQQVQHSAEVLSNPDFLDLEGQISRINENRNAREQDCAAEGSRDHPRGGARLYLAKLAGAWTEAEVRGPEFSRDSSPFMLENFFEAKAVRLVCIAMSRTRHWFWLSLVLYVALRASQVLFVGPMPAAPTRTSMAATKKKGAVKKGGKYRGVVNPRLRNFIQSSEYRELLTLLKNVNDEGVLDDFLAKAETYWMDINIFQLAMEEQSGGGRGVVATVKRDWPKIWPPQLEGNRMYAFDCFAKFWGRLERSKLVDDVMSEVLPDLGKDYSEKLESKDQQKLMQMSDDERRDEIMSRLGTSPIVAQYAALSKEDPEVKAIGSKMAPFVAKFVSILERKVSTQTESLGQTVDVVVVGVIAVVVLIGLSFAGIIKIPDPTW
ncbi:PHOT1 [Symbiodinium natans]|uniref:PHOT1 protein n=1 Tax=Symbiodinium natans TaxID=878477 RepID=A0A812P9L1_9DINO|nr:PHOT1 [Symbiodinium natans]